MKISCWSVHTQDKTDGIQLIGLQCSSFSHGGFSLSYKVFWSTSTFQERLCELLEMQSQVCDKFTDLGL